MKTKIIMVNIVDVDCIVSKSDATIVYLKNGKYWVCERVEELNPFLKLLLKGKSE